MVFNISRKKHFWETVARQYFGDLNVKKKRIDKLRLAWRRNERGIREKVNGSYKDKNEGKRKIYSTSKSVSSDSESSESASDDVANAEGTRPKIKGNDKPSSFNKMAEFLGGVIRSGISSIYREHFMEENGDQVMHKTTLQSQDRCRSSKKMATTSSCNIASETKPASVLKDLSSDDCLSYEVHNKETQSDKFLDIPNISGVTAKSLSKSNLPSSGIFRAELSKDVSYVTLPSSWREIPVKNITDQKQRKTHRAFDAGYTSFFSDILKKFNPYCCWIFKRNDIKKANSRKKSSPYWCGTATCKFGDVSVQLSIQNREDGVLKVRFTGNVCHDITSPKAKNITGSDRTKLIDHAWKSNQEPSKMHRDNLLRIDPDYFSAGVRTGSGLTHGTMKGIKAEAKARHQGDHDLTKSLSQLHDSIAKEDENHAINLGHSWRKFFGYIQMYNMSPTINIVLFNEASLRLYHELSRHDIVYIDATGNLFANEKKYNRLLYYAMVLRNPFALNSPTPIVEYITSRHTADSIGLMIRTLKEQEREIFAKGVIPALVMSDFSMAIINACLWEFNNESLEDYFGRGFRIVSGKAT